MVSSITRMPSSYCFNVLVQDGYVLAMDKQERKENEENVVVGY